MKCKHTMLTYSYLPHRLRAIHVNNYNSYLAQLAIIKKNTEVPNLRDLILAIGLFCWHNTGIENAILLTVHSLTLKGILTIDRPHKISLPKIYFN